MMFARVVPIALMTLLALPITAGLGGEARPTVSSDAAQFGSTVVSPRLTGIISAPGASVAVFDPGPQHPALIVRVGDKLGEWTVVHIGPGIVIMTNGSEQVTISPDETTVVGPVAAPDWKIGQRRSTTMSNYLQRRQAAR